MVFTRSNNSNTNNTTTNTVAATDAVAQANNDPPAIDPQAVIKAALHKGTKANKRANNKAKADQQRKDEVAPPTGPRAAKVKAAADKANNASSKGAQPTKRARANTASSAGRPRKATKSAPVEPVDVAMEVDEPVKKPAKRGKARAVKKGEASESEYESEDEDEGKKEDSDGDDKVEGDEAFEDDPATVTDVTPAAMAEVSAATVAEQDDGNAKPKRKRNPEKLNEKLDVSVPANVITVPIVNPGTVSKKRTFFSATPAKDEFEIIDMGSDLSSVEGDEDKEAPEQEQVEAEPDDYAVQEDVAAMAIQDKMHQQMLEDGRLAKAIQDNEVAAEKDYISVHDTDSEVEAPKTTSAAKKTKANPSGKKKKVGESDSDDGPQVVSAPVNSTPGTGKKRSTQSPYIKKLLSRKGMVQDGSKEERETGNKPKVTVKQEPGVEVKLEPDVKVKREPGVKVKQEPFDEDRFYIEDVDEKWKGKGTELTFEIGTGKAATVSEQAVNSVHDVLQRAMNRNLLEELLMGNHDFGAYPDSKEDAYEICINALIKAAEEIGHVNIAERLRTDKPYARHLAYRVWGRRSHVRTEIVGVVRNCIEKVFNLNGKPTRERGGPLTTKEQFATEAARLSHRAKHLANNDIFIHDGTWVLKDGAREDVWDMPDHSWGTPFACLSIATVCANAFVKPGVKWAIPRDMFPIAPDWKVNNGAKKPMMKMTLIAFVAACIRHVLGEYQNGSHEPLKFDETQSKADYQRYMDYMDVEWDDKQKIMSLMSIYDMAEATFVTKGQKLKQSKVSPEKMAEFFAKK